MNLSEKIKDFFSGQKETNNDGNLIEAIDVLNVEESIPERRNSVEKNKLFN